MTDDSFLKLVRSDIDTFLTGCLENPVTGKDPEVLVFPRLSSYHRFLVHDLIVENYPLLSSQSVGQDSERHIVISFKNATVKTARQTTMDPSTINIPALSLKFPGAEKDKTKKSTKPGKEAYLPPAARNRDGSPKRSKKEIKESPKSSGSARARRVSPTRSPLKRDSPSREHGHNEKTKEKRSLFSGERKEGRISPKKLERVCDEKPSQSGVRSEARFASPHGNKASETSPAPKYHSHGSAPVHHIGCATEKPVAPMEDGEIPPGTDDVRKSYFSPRHGPKREPEHPDVKREPQEKSWWKSEPLPPEPPRLPAVPPGFALIRNDVLIVEALPPRPVMSSATDPVHRYTAPTSAADPVYQPFPLFSKRKAEESSAGLREFGESPPPYVSVQSPPYSNRSHGNDQRHRDSSSSSSQRHRFGNHHGSRGFHEDGVRHRESSSSSRQNRPPPRSVTSEASKPAPPGIDLRVKLVSTEQRKPVHSRLGYRTPPQEPLSTPPREPVPNPPSNSSPAFRDSPREPRPPSRNLPPNPASDCPLSTAILKELSGAFGDVNLSHPASQYDAFGPERASSVEPDVDAPDFHHVIEMYDFPNYFLTADLQKEMALITGEPFDVRFVDDTHALAVFGSVEGAGNALRMKTAGARVKVRSLPEASEQARVKAKACIQVELLSPYRERPETSIAAAHRMVAGALGMKISVPKAKREEEARLLKEAKEKKVRVAKIKDDMWEGNV